MSGILVIAWFVSAAVGAIIGLQKGKPAKGAILGMLLGPIGWVLAAVDARIVTITLLLAVVVGVVIAGIVSIQRDQDTLAAMEQDRLAQMANYKRARLMGGPPDASSPSAPAPSPDPGQPSPSPIAQVPQTAYGVAYPAGVDTPEERREYLQMLTERRKQAN